MNRDLDACGFPLCKGDIMARNPRWCLTLREWRGAFDDWIRNTDPEALLHASIFFDFRPLAGERSWRAGCATRCWRRPGEPRFLPRMAQAALQARPPLGLLADFSADELDLKRAGARPFVDAARVLALGIGSAETGTAARLQRGERGHRGGGLPLPPDAAPAARSNRVRVAELNDIDRRVLKGAFRQASCCSSASRWTTGYELVPAHAARRGALGGGRLRDQRPRRRARPAAVGRRGGGARRAGPDLAEFFQAKVRQAAPSARENILIHGIGGDAQRAGRRWPRSSRRCTRSSASACRWRSMRRSTPRCCAATGSGPRRNGSTSPRSRRRCSRRRAAPTARSSTGCAAFGIAPRARHDALGDAFAAAQLLLVALSEAKRQRVETVEGLREAAIQGSYDRDLVAVAAALGEAEVRGELQHVAVRFQDVPDQRLVLRRARRVAQPLEQRAAQALGLPVVGDGQREFGGEAVLVGRVAADGDELVLPERDQRELAVVVELGEAREHARGKLRQVLHEAL